MEEFSDDFRDNSEIKLLIDKFTKLVNSKGEAFFDVEDFEILIFHFIQNNQLELAKTAVDMALSQHPFSLDIQILQSEYLLATGKLNKALNILLKLQTVEAGNPEVMALIADIYSQQHDSKEAIKYYKKAIALNHEDSLDIKFNIGIEYQNLAEYDKALHLLKEVLWEDPENEAIGFEIIYCYTLADKDEEAVEFFQSFVDAYPYSFIAWYNLGTCLIKADLLEKAIRAFDYCTIVDQDIHLGFFQKALIQLELNRFEDAIDTYKDLLELEPNNITALLAIAECYDKLDDLETAELYFNAALGIDEENAEAWLGLALLCSRSERLNEALTFAEKSIKIEPKNTSSLCVKAEIEQELGQIDLAQLSYEEALLIEPDNHLATLDYSNLLEEHFSVEAAIELLQSYIEENDFIDALILYRLTVYLIKKGDLREAYSYFEEAIQLNFDDHDSVFRYYPASKKITELNMLVELYRK